MTRSLRINWILRSASLAGGVRTVCQLAEALEARGHRSTITHLDDASPRPAPYRVRAYARRLLRDWSVRGRERTHLDYTAIPSFGVKGDRVRASDVPDADITIGTWWETMEWIADWPAEKGRHAYYVQHYELHGGDPERARATYRQPGLKIVIARWLERLMAEEFGETNSVLVPNGLDAAQFESPPRKRQHPPRVGLMTSEKDWKRTDVALRAIGLAREAIPELRAFGFGTAPLTRPLQALAPPDFELHVRPPQAEIPRLYQASDLWLLSSDSEGFGLPGLEAAASRCPVIATRCGGPEDYVDDGVSGHLVPVGDASAMAERIVQVLQAPEAAWEAMSEASHRISQRFRWERSAETLERALLTYLES